MATEKRDLRSGVSIWHEPVLPAQALTGDLEVEVLIIGGGVTGAMIAESLSKNFSVTIVDQRGPARGSTMASTGLLLFELDTPLTELRKKIGRRRADRAWTRSHQAMRKLVKTIEQLKIDCDMATCSSIYLPGKTLDAKGLQKEADARIQCGLPSAYIGDRELKSQFPVSGKAAIVSGNSAKVDPVRFALGFLRCAMSSGAKFYSGVNIVGIDVVDDCVVAATAGGLKITAQFVVFATGYEIPRYVPMRRHEIASTWAIATVRQPLDSWVHGALIWEASDPYCYVRTTHDGRVLIGGEDENFDGEEKRKKLTPTKVEKLRGKLHKLLPHLDTTVEFVWSGAFGRSSSGLPSIGALPGMPHCFAVLGFGGNGMTYAMIGAQLIERLIVGARDPDQDLFAFSSD